MTSISFQMAVVLYLQHLHRYHSIFPVRYQFNICCNNICNVAAIPRQSEQQRYDEAFEPVQEDVQNAPQEVSKAAKVTDVQNGAAAARNIKANIEGLLIYSNLYNCWQTSRTSLNPWQR